MRKLIYVAAAALLMAACQHKEDPAPEAIGEGNKINLTISVDVPQVKATFAAGETPSLEWTGDETLSVLIGRDSVTTNKAGGLQVTLNSVPGRPGTFSGEVQLDTFTVNDIKGIVVPAENGAYFAYDNGTNRICMPVVATQTQNENGVFNPAYNPFFAEISGFGAADADGKHLIADLQLYSGVDLIGLNVYGRHPQAGADEVLKSVKLFASDKITGVSKYNIGNIAIDKYGVGVSTNTSNNVTVNFGGNETIADKTKENGIKLFAAVAMNGTREYSKVEVVTDKAVYTKVVDFTNPAQKDIRNLVVYNAGLNLTTFERLGNGLTYSTDGGNTWVSELPAQLDGELAVNGTSLKSDDLAAIKALLASQSTATALDLSQTKFESATFPATFAGTEAAPNTYLKSIRFPSNVTTIAASAFLYCTAMTSVDLTGITTINNSAFRYCGLETLNVPTSVISYGTYIFADNEKLTSVYWNSKKPDDSSKTNYYTFYVTESTPTCDLTVTIGPDIVYISRTFLRHNNNLKTLVVEKSLKARNYYLVQSEYLETIQFLSATPDVSCGTMWDAGHVRPGAKVSGTKQIIVPKGASTAYAANAVIKKLTSDAGYTIVEAAE